MSAREGAVAVIAVGDELLEGLHADSNSVEIARAVQSTGREARRFLVLRDDEERVAAEIAAAAAEHAVVIVTGGLGPTLDDVTRHAAARAAGVPLERSEAAAAAIRAWFERSHRPMAESNARQALVPRGAAVLSNALGTAPGFRLAIGDATLFALPGPPREMRAMLAEHVLPWLAAHRVEGWAREAASFFLYDLSESVFADRVGAWMDRGANPLMTVTASSGVLSVRLVAHAATREEAAELLAARAEELRARFDAHLFSETSGDLAQALGAELLARGLTLATAESCTGGMVAAAVTRVSGISAVYREGFVTYSNEAKEARLGVPAEWIARHGAVSRETAEAMASGAARAAAARLAVAVTGIAGPGGGTPEKPVGLVCFATVLDGRVESQERRFPPAGREPIREWATNLALGLAWARARRA